MIGNWTTWKRFPNAERGEHVDAPIGPGIFEVRRVSNGELVSFDSTANVAFALSSLLRRPPSRSWRALFSARKASSWISHYDLEYRTCGAASAAEARMMAQCLNGRRQAYWRRTPAMMRMSRSLPA
jgi:hypothetical protein